MSASRTLRWELGAGLMLSLAAVAGWAAPMLPEIELLRGDVVRGEPTRIEQVEIPGADSEAWENYVLVLDGQAMAFPLEELAEIRWQPKQTISFASGADTQCHSFGGDLISPLPSDWGGGGETISWGPVEAPQMFHGWRHLPGAQWVWSESGWFSFDHVERVVFRQDFEVPEAMDVIGGELRLAVDDRVEAVRINGRDLPIPTSTDGLITWDITQAVQGGMNRVAIVAVDRPRNYSQVQGHAINAAGLAFRGEIFGVLDAAVALPRPSVVAHCINGDRIVGDLTRIDDSRVVIASPVGPFTLDRDWITELLISASSTPGRLPLISGSVHVASPLTFTEPHSVPDWAPGLLLADGTHLSGRVLRTSRRGAILVKPRYSDESEVPLEEIQAVYMNAPSTEGFFHYPRENGPRICRVETIGGLRLSGVLRQVGSNLVINTPQMDSVSIPRARLVTTVFPMSCRLRVWESVSRRLPPEMRRLEMWGQRRETETALTYEENLIAQISQIAVDLRLDLEWIDDVDLATSQMHGDDHPLMLMVDERQEFPISVRSEGDGLEALRSYLRTGGTLILIPSGIPFYHGREWNGQRWVGRPLRQSIPNSLGFGYLAPGESSESGRAFEIPENRGERLHFVRVTDEGVWRSMPERIPFPSLEDSRFRPVLPVEEGIPTTFEPIYRLVSDTGVNCGTAMAVIRPTEGEFAAGQIYHIAPALALAADETGEPALHRLLPGVIADALTRSREPSGLPDGPVPSPSVAQSAR